MTAIKLSDDDFAALIDAYIDISDLKRTIANTGLLLDLLSEQRLRLGFKLTEYDCLKPALYAYA